MVRGDPADPLNEIPGNILSSISKKIQYRDNNTNKLVSTENNQKINKMPVTNIDYISNIKTERKFSIQPSKIPTYSEFMSKNNTANIFSNNNWNDTLHKQIIRNIKQKYNYNYFRTALKVVIITMISVLVVRKSKIRNKRKLRKIKYINIM